MDMKDVSRYQDLIMAAVTNIGLKLLAAIVFWVIGRWLISLVLGMIRKALERQKVDPTVLRYLSSVVSVTLNVFLVIGILGYFGVQTTTFAALVAGVGIAIGAAWAGLLANFAAGAFMITLRPFKVGDFVTVAGVTGTVTEIGLFATTLNTPDNVSTVIGNNKIFGDNIQNFVTNPFRRVELKCQLSGAADHRAAIALLREKIAALPNVLATPPDRNRHPRIQPGRPSAGGAPLLPQRPLLAGVFRHQQGAARSPGRSRIPGPDAGAERGGYAERVAARRSGKGPHGMGPHCCRPRCHSLCSCGTVNCTNPRTQEKHAFPIQTCTSSGNGWHRVGVGGPCGNRHTGVSGQLVTGSLWRRKHSHLQHLSAQRERIGGNHITRRVSRR